MGYKELVIQLKEQLEEIDERLAYIERRRESLDREEERLKEKARILFRGYRPSERVVAANGKEYMTNHNLPIKLNHYVFIHRNGKVGVVSKKVDDICRVAFFGRRGHVSDLWFYPHEVTALDPYQIKSSDGWYLV